MSAASSLFDRAFELAFFLHRDRAVALGIATAAAAKLAVTATAERKRFYYLPIGRRSGAVFRSKVVLPEAPLLQRLVYLESEPWERQSEAAADVGEEILLLRFVKHLVRLTLKRNAFYVTLGLGRVLHDYPTSATLDLYGLVVGDPDRVPDDAYCRARKRQLMQELRQRFGERLEVCHGPRGEERFCSHRPPWVEALVRRALTLFTPWGTECPLPPRLASRWEEIITLRFFGSDPDGEHPVELRRLHALLHPPCFARLAAALGLGAPAEHLTVPRFAQAMAANGSPPVPEPLSLGERRKSARDVAAQASLRRRLQPETLTVVIDGERRARLLAGDEGVTLVLSEDAERAELWASSPDGEVLVALHFLAPRPPRGRPAVVRLPGGGQVSFVVALDLESETWRLTVRWQPAGSLTRVFAGSPRIWLPASAAAILLLVATVLWLPRTPTGDLAPVGPRTDGELHRGPAAPEAAKALLWVPPLGDDAYGRELRQHLGRALAARGLGEADEPGSASVALRRLVTADGVRILALVDAGGTLLWTLPEDAASGRDAARAAAAAAAGLVQRHSP